MKVDRIAFLGLVATMAAGACVVSGTDTDGEGGQGGSGNTSQGGSGNTSQGGSGNTGQGGVGAVGGSGGEAATGGSGGQGGGVCDDSQGSPAECTSVPVDCDPYCQAAHNNLKPFIAELAVDCLTVATGYCNEGYECFGEALGYACYDATADDDCATAVTACTYETITTDDCHALLDGLTDTARDEVMACVDDGCDFGLWSCVEGVAFWME